MDIFSFFKKKKEVFEEVEELQLDIHSHLLPGIDDGAKSLEDSILMIKHFAALGYKKLITTPHIMGDFYRNTPEIIHEKLDLVNAALKEQNIDVSLSAAAEYYLDESFLEKLNKNEKLLTFGDNYLLFETSYVNLPPQLDEAIFKIQAAGYKPVLAHPERYIYLYDKPLKIDEIKEKGVLLQINLLSLIGYYSPAAHMFSESLIKKGIVSFLGTDCHSDKHLRVLEQVRKTLLYNKALRLNILNNSLM